MTPSSAHSLQTSTSATPGGPGRLTARQKFWITTFFFLLVFSLRLCLVYLYACDSPYSDQWDAEGWSWLRPYQSGQIDWSVLIAAHNEHRIALTRLVSLALFALNNGQWDNLVSATFGVFFFATVCTLAFRTMLDLLTPVMWPVPAFLAAACCLPCGYENLVIGFQIEFYFLITLTLLGVWLAASRTVDIKLTIVLGVIAYLCLFSLASGLFTSVVIAIAAALRLRATRESWLAALPLFAILVSAAISGYFLLVHTPQHANLQAQNIWEWLDALRLVASWPMPASWFAVAIVWLPTLLGGLAMLRNRDPDATGIAALAIGAWTAVQIAGMAYGRAHNMIYVNSRYTDVLALTVLVNAFFCLRLLQSAVAPASTRTRVAIACVWLTVITGAYAVQGAIGLKAMQDFAASRQLQSDNVRIYLLSPGSSSPVIDAALPWNLPYPNKQRLKMMLNDATIRDMLPAGVRAQIPLGAYANGFGVNAMPAAVTKPRGRGAYGTYLPGTGSDNTADLHVSGLHSRFPYLLFSVTGFLDSADLSLEVQSDDGASLRKVAPWTAANESWKDVMVATPAVDFSLRAHDGSHDRWFAFTAPVELGRLSYWTHELLGISPALLLASLLAIVFAVMFSVLLRLYVADDNPVHGPPPDSLTINARPSIG